MQYERWSNRKIETVQEGKIFGVGSQYAFTWEYYQSTTDNLKSIEYYKIEVFYSSKRKDYRYIGNYIHHLQSRTHQITRPIEKYRLTTKRIILYLSIIITAT